MSTQPAPFPHIRHQADLCVLGGGITGICAALAAACSTRPPRIAPALLREVPVLQHRTTPP
jgi:succinate dehydrogenase/fumarate reductase flavoprotein subunit